MYEAPNSLGEAKQVIAAMHDALLSFRHQEFDLIKRGRYGEFDDRVKEILRISAPTIKSIRAHNIK